MVCYPLTTLIPERDGIYVSRHVGVQALLGMTARGLVTHANMTADPSTATLRVETRPDFDLAPQADPTCDGPFPDMRLNFLATGAQSVHIFETIFRGAALEHFHGFEGPEGRENFTVTQPSNDTDTFAEIHVTCIPVPRSNGIMPEVFDVCSSNRLHEHAADDRIGSRA
jgi:hypothetical protein